MNIEELKAELAKPAYAGMTPEQALAALSTDSIPLPPPPPPPPPPTKTSVLKQKGWTDIGLDDVKTALGVAFVAPPASPAPVEAAAEKV